MKKLGIITGEASGDLHGAKLIQAIRALDSDLEIHAVGGKLIQDENCASFLSMAHWNVMGFTEVIRILPEALKMFRQIIAWVKDKDLDAIIFIDNPGFNLRLAKKLKHLGIPMMYYICPQIWAWNQKRANVMRELFTKCFVIFDFEEKFYKQKGVPVQFVGHPIRDRIESAKLRIMPQVKSQILLMPGSRGHELERMLPIMLKASKLIKNHIPDSEFAVLKSNTISTERYSKMLQAFPHISLRNDEHYQAMEDADLALVCSGTATLECMLHHLPMVVGYRLSPISYHLLKQMVTIKFMALPNLIANEELMPELIQDECTAENFTKHAIAILQNSDVWRQKTKDLETMSRRLGPPGAAQVAAKAILQTIA